MSKFYRLTRVLLKNGLQSSTGKKRKNISFLIVVIALLPFILGTTAALYAGYGTLVKYGLDGVILASLEAASCVVMVVFGILYVISIYYFTDDTVQLLTLPLKPEQILASKFVIVNIYQYLLEALILLPCILAYTLRVHSPAFILYALITFLTMPLIPTVICSLISILLMAFGRFFRNKDRVKVIAGLLGITIAIVVNILIQTLSNGIASGDAATLLASKKGLIEQATFIFPSVRLSSAALLESASLSGFLNLLGFLAANVAAIVIFLALGKGLYLSGVVGLTQSASGRGRISREAIGKLETKKTTLFALAVKDSKMLLRTPAYLLNCVIGGMVFPPLMVCIVGFSSANTRIPDNAFTLAIGALILTFVCIFNLASPTAVSREGKDAYFSRYIPVPYRTQVLAKLMPGLVMSWISAVIVSALALVIFRINLVLLLMIFVSGVLLTTALNMIGLFFDILNPKLEWDDETAAVKRNYNFLIELLLAFVLLVICLAGEFILRLSSTGMFLLLIMIGVVLCFAFYKLLVTKGTQIFSGFNSGFYNTFLKTADRKVSTGRFGARIAKIIVSISGAVFVVVIGGILITEFTAKTTVDISATSVHISGGLFEKCSFPAADISKVYLSDSIPNAYKVNGFGSGNDLRGVFQVKGMGKGNVYTQSGKGPFLYVIYKGGFAIINYSDSSKTQQLYNRLKNYGNGNP